MKYNRNNPIGVLDSGVGGLTVVRELRRLLPCEDIIYYGDNANCPYGNRTQENILELTRNMLCFVKEKRVKLVAVACNTISTLIDQFAGDYDFSILSIIRPIAERVVRDGLEEVGVIATEFTIRTKCYESLIQQGNFSIQVYGEPSRDLAKLVDMGDFEGTAIQNDVNLHVSKLLAEHPVKHIILGCTHFPIIVDAFKQAAPEVDFLNPALEQAFAVKERLHADNLLNQGKNGSLNIYTSGSPEVYENMLSRLEVGEPYAIHIETN